jgi:hypothetical protein
VRKGDSSFLRGVPPLCCIPLTGSSVRMIVIEIAGEPSSAQRASAGGRPLDQYVVRVVL